MAGGVPDPHCAVIVSGSKQHGADLGRRRRSGRDPLTGHNGGVNAVVIGGFNDRDVIVSGSNDRTVRIWDTAGDPVANPLTGHTVW